MWQMLQISLLMTKALCDRTSNISGRRFLTAVHWLLKRITAFGDKTAVISETRRHSYRESSDLVFSWDKKFAKAGINAGAVTAVCGDYSADTIAALIALLGWRTIVVPITQMPIAEMEKRFKLLHATLSSHRSAMIFAFLQNLQKTRLRNH